MYRRNVLLWSLILVFLVPFLLFVFWHVLKLFSVERDVEDFFLFLVYLEFYIHFCFCAPQKRSNDIKCFFFFGNSEGVMLFPAL